eukprot:15101126-Alexandrium_andersonii.AAC.1
MEEQPASDASTLALCAQWPRRGALSPWQPTARRARRARSFAGAATGTGPPLRAVQAVSGSPDDQVRPD